MKIDFSKIHPELQQVAKRTPKLEFNKGNLWLMRILMSLMPPAKLLQGVLIENMLIPAESGEDKIRLRVYKPKVARADAPVLIWMHGGGYVVGRPEQDDACCSYYVQELGITVFSPAYRYAPKYPFPIGLYDCYAALRWVVSQAGKLGIDPKRIAIGGQSAGGGLAAALVQLAYDRQEFNVAMQLLVYPMLDDKTVLRSEIDDSNNITWTQKSNQFGWESYLGTSCGAKDVPAYAVPARREDLSNLPPAWIGVGTLDVFHDEDLEYAKRLKASGVKVELTVIEGAFHGFDVFDPKLEVVQFFRKSQVAALKKYLFPSSSL
jgi:acetyl esterase/lipase